jgi:hypothetical protein
MLVVERFVVTRYLYSSKYWTSNRTHWLYLGPLRDLKESNHSVGASPSFDLKTEIDSVCEMLCLAWSTRQWTKSRNSEIKSLIHILPSEHFSINLWSW